MANNSMTPAPETAALVERLLAMASDLRCTAASCHDQGSVLAVTNKAFALDLDSAASLLSQPEPQGTASDREIAESCLPKPTPGVEWQERLYGEAVEHIASALAGEREAAAKVAEEFADAASDFGDGLGLIRYEKIAAAIRAGGQEG